MMSHHLKTLMVIIRTIFRILILGLARLAYRLLPISMCTVNPHEALTFRFHQIYLRIVEPAVDEVAVEAIAVADLVTVRNGWRRMERTNNERNEAGSDWERTSPQASLKGGAPFHP
jgi:hypothetical protein